MSAVGSVKIYGLSWDSNIGLVSEVTPPKSCFILTTAKITSCILMVFLRPSFAGSPERAPPASTCV